MFMLIPLLVTAVFCNTIWASDNDKRTDASLIQQFNSNSTAIVPTPSIKDSELMATVGKRLLDQYYQNQNSAAGFWLLLLNREITPETKALFLKAAEDNPATYGLTPAQQAIITHLFLQRESMLSEPNSNEQNLKSLERIVHEGSQAASVRMAGYLTINKAFHSAVASGDTAHAARIKEAAMASNIPLFDPFDQVPARGNCTLL